MTTNFSFNFINKTIVCTKAALKKAGDPATKEYRELMKMMEMQPTFSIVEREIKKSTTKRTYNGLTKSFMISYIENQKDCASKMAEFNKALEMGGYPLAKSWFIKTFEGFKMTKGRETVAERKIQTIKINAHKTASFPKAVNQ